MKFGINSRQYWNIFTKKPDIWLSSFLVRVFCGVLSSLVKIRVILDVPAETYVTVKDNKSDVDQKIHDGYERTDHA